MNTLKPILALFVLTALAACMPTPPPIASPPSVAESADATATPSAESAGPQAATVLITTSLLTVIDDEGTTIDHFDYFDEPTAAIAAFTEYFGGEPVISPFEGNFHSWPGNHYSWDGFAIIDHVGGPGIPFGEDFAVSTTVSEVRGLQIETVSSISVGATAAAVTAAGGTGGSYDYDGTTVTWLELDHVSADSESPESLVFVYVTLTAPEGAVTQLAAPAANYGP